MSETILTFCVATPLMRKALAILDDAANGQIGSQLFREW